MTFTTAGLGTGGELRAAAWLLEQGYYVFRNVSGQGPADLVIWKPGEPCTLVDVKVARPYKRRDGSVGYSRNPNGFSKYAGIRWLLYDPECGRCMWWEDVEQKPPLELSFVDEAVEEALR